MARRPRSRIHDGNRVLRIGSATAVWLYVVVLALPLYYLLTSSLKSNLEIFSDPIALPTKWLWRNFPTAFDLAQLGPALTNSTVVVIGSLAITLALSIPAAYALARAQGRIGRAVEGLFGLGFLIPGFAALLPTLLVAIAVGLFQTREYLMLFLPATALPLSVILLTQYMRSIPAELEESAMLDGAGRFRILANIYLPMSMPGVVSIVVLNFITFWNEYLFSLVLAGPKVDTRTVQVALPTLASTHNSDFGLVSAGAVISLIPVYLAYAVLQRRLEGAMAAGALKG